MQDVARLWAAGTRRVQQWELLVRLLLHGDSELDVPRAQLALLHCPAMHLALPSCGKHWV